MIQHIDHRRTPLVALLSRPLEPESETEDRIARGEWGGWVLNRELLTLSYRVTEHYEYEIDLEDPVHMFKDPDATAFHIYNKKWAGSDCVLGVRQALTDIGDRFRR